ncbi:hypothetical protein LIER_07221 [Lithospermum erythrorhizon]|uniref:TTF-type domain-containing protein n=1 Tax=Lithospermum erythrorhizon TaxID=34254 RepID=A0AAV3P8D4_LITER
MQDSMRRTFLIKGPHRSNMTIYSTSDMGGKRKFKPEWYAPYLEWMEYSEHDDAVFCLPCYLFKDVTKYDGDSFVGRGNGLKDWNHSTEGLNRHASSDCHKLFITKCRNLMSEKQSIYTSLRKQNEIVDSEYTIKLKISFLAARLLMQGGQAFQDHDEKEDSSYQGHFIEYVKELRISYGIKDFRGMTFGQVQKELCCASAFLVTSKIVKDIGNDFFAILNDESGDCAGKEQMALQEFLQEAQLVHLVELIEEGLVETGGGLNQESSLLRAGETRWGSHYKALTSISTLFSLVLSVLHQICEDVSCKVQGEAKTLLTLLHTFDFIFMLSLMVDVLDVTHDLNMALQRCDQDLLNALNLVRITKLRLQRMRDDC